MTEITKLRIDKEIIICSDARRENREKRGGKRKLARKAISSGVCSKGGVLGVITHSRISGVITPPPRSCGKLHDRLGLYPSNLMTVCYFNLKFKRNRLLDKKVMYFDNQVTPLAA